MYVSPTGVPVTLIFVITSPFEPSELLPIHYGTDALVSPSARAVSK